MPNHTRKYSKFEKTRIISARALQIAQGSPVLVDLPKGHFKPIDIAMLEWDEGVIPIDIKKESKKEEGKKEEK
jgi:DNA-directed RNA polymerase subunit K/omega